MPRVLLVLPSASYRTNDFVEAAAELGVDIAVATEAHQTFADARPNDYVTIDVGDPRRAADTIVEWANNHPVDAVMAVDDQGVVTAALAATALGIPSNPPSAAAATRNKVMLRRALVGVVPQPSFTILGPNDDPAEAASHVGLPAIVKPLWLSASRGVIRVDTPEDARIESERVRRILAAAGGNPNEALLIERFVSGPEVAIDGLLQGGEWTTLAVFDKPEALDGPYFAETIYTTPSRHHPEMVAEIERVAADAAAGIGLREGAVHAEVRIHGSSVVLLELAARSIGGLCGRALRFGLLGNSLEHLLLRHAVGIPVRDPKLLDDAAGVLMVPVPHDGIFRGIDRVDEALAVDGVTAIEVGTVPGTRVAALPGHSTYLAFAFAHADSPKTVESALRAVQRTIEVHVDPTDDRPATSPSGSTCR